MQSGLRPPDGPGAPAGPAGSPMVRDRNPFAPPPGPINPKGLPVFEPSMGGAHYSDSAGAHKLYGAMIDQQLEARAAASRLCRQRKRINCVSALLALLMPWGTFVAVFGFVSFYPHYAAPVSTSLGALLVLVASVGCLSSAVQAWKTGSEDRFIQLYIGAALTIAATLGWILGDINFWQFMQPSYHIDHLATYSNVDPSSQMLWSGEQVPVRGRRFQDAGKIYFSHNAEVDLSKAASFKQGRNYCVAPIVNPACHKNCGYDFWAIGIDCCPEAGKQFRCGDVNSTQAKSGLRQIVESWRPLFRLAVLQAEGEHNIISRHPIFFYWVEDPYAELLTWKLAGYKRFIVVMLGTFVLNACALHPVLKSARLAD